jgi:hypothetical protein
MDIVIKFKHRVTRNKNLSIHQNLLDSFQLVDNDNDAYEDYTTTGDIECGICYSYKLNNSDTPDIICSNISCSRGFHYQCLYEVSFFFFFKNYVI